MLYITIPIAEQWDETNEEFIPAKEQKLQLEHSLVSISKWESKWKKPFISDKEKTTEEIVDYIRCMTITQNVDPDTYGSITDEIVGQVKSYISDTMTATWFSDEKTSKTSSEAITNELIYYWMTAYNIPFKCEKWHINRLLTLIKICNIKNQPPKKMSKRDTARQYAALNKARRKRSNSRG